MGNECIFVGKGVMSLGKEILFICVQGHCRHGSSACMNGLLLACIMMDWLYARLQKLSVHGSDDQLYILLTSLVPSRKILDHRNTGPATMLQPRYNEPSSMCLTRNTYFSHLRFHFYWQSESELSKAYSSSDFTPGHPNLNASLSLVPFQHHEHCAVARHLI